MKHTSERFLYGMVLLALAIQVAIIIAAHESVSQALAGVCLLLLALAAWSLRGKLVLSRPQMAVLQGTQAQLKDDLRERDAKLVVAHEGLREEHLELRWKNQALEHQLYYADLIIGSIADAVVVVSQAMKITRVNPSLTTHTGFTATELIGQPLEKVMRPAFEAGKDHQQLLAEALKREEELADRNAYLVAKNGNITPATFHFTLVRDSGKVVAGVVALRLQSKTAPGPQTAVRSKSA